MTWGSSHILLLRLTVWLGVGTPALPVVLVAAAQPVQEREQQVQVPAPAGPEHRINTRQPIRTIQAMAAIQTERIPPAMVLRLAQTVGTIPMEGLPPVRTGRIPPVTEPHLEPMAGTQRVMLPAVQTGRIPPVMGLHLEPMAGTQPAEPLPGAERTRPAMAQRPGRMAGVTIPLVQLAGAGPVGRIPHRPGQPVAHVPVVAAALTRQVMAVPVAPAADGTVAVLPVEHTRHQLAQPVLPARAVEATTPQVPAPRLVHRLVVPVQELAELRPVRLPAVIQQRVDRRPGQTRRPHQRRDLTPGRDHQPIRRAHPVAIMVR